MKKILLLGNSGAGKSTLAKILSENKNIPHLHLDTIVYKNDWKEDDFPIIENKINDFIKNDSWIIDGNFLNRAVKRFTDCDTIIFLDLNRYTCLFSVLKRYFKYKGKYRDSRNETCDEKITFSYLNWVFFNFYKTSRKKIIKMCENNEKNILIFKTRKEVKKYMEELKK